MARITRQRKLGSGNKRAHAERLRELILARKTGGYPTRRREILRLVEAGKQAYAQIEAALARVQSRARQRTLGARQVWWCMAQSAETGLSEHVDGGSLTASSYGYRWSATSCHVEFDGAYLVVHLSRSSAEIVRVPIRVARYTAPRSDGWICYRSETRRDKVLEDGRVQKWVKEPDNTWISGECWRG